MHIDSHYAATLLDQQRYPTLAGQHKFQSCVIGAGFAGLTCARELQRKGQQVALIDAKCVGWGASGRNGGFVSAGFARSIASVAKKIGWQEAKNLYRLSQYGRDYVRQSMKELNLEDSIYGNGWLRLIRNKNTGELKKTRDQMAKWLDVEWEFIDNNQLGKFVNSARYYAGLHDDAPFHIHPLQYANGLAKDFVARGGEIFEQTRCTDVVAGSQTGQGRWIVNTPNGKIHAQDVILATSAYGGPRDALNRTMVPVATYVVSTQPCAQLLQQTLPFKGCIGDTRRSGDYYRGIGDGDDRRLIWGGRITTMKTQPVRLAQMLKRDIASVYPQLADLEIERAWSGLMGYSAHQMPIIAQMQEGLWAATAFGGHGLNTTAMAGQLVSSAICEGNDEYKRFAPFGLRWSGGFAGKVATQLEYWRLQFLDWRDETRSYNL